MILLSLAIYSATMSCWIFLFSKNLSIFFLSLLFFFSHSWKASVISHLDHLLLLLLFPPPLLPPALLFLLLLYFCNSCWTMLSLFNLDPPAKLFCTLYPKSSLKHPITWTSQWHSTSLEWRCKYLPWFITLFIIWSLFTFYIHQSPVTLDLIWWLEFRKTVLWCQGLCIDCSIC